MPTILVSRIAVPVGLRCTTRILGASSSRRLQVHRLSHQYDGSTCIDLHHHPFSLARVASFSTQASGGSSGGIRGWFEDRNKRKQQEQYMEQMKRLSEMKELTLQSYKEELDRGLNQWGAKISFLQTKEVKIAQEIVTVVQALIDVKGGEATADDLSKMDRLERLKVATASKKTVEELSMLISQIQNMDLMQRTLRKRYLEGKSIPPDPTSMQAAIKKDAMSIMTKAQKEEMMKRQATMAQRSMRKRR